MTGKQKLLQMKNHENNFKHGTNITRVNRTILLVFARSPVSSELCVSKLSLCSVISHGLTYFYTDVAENTTEQISLPSKISVGNQFLVQQWNCGW